MQTKRFYVCHQSDTIQIPFSDIEQLRLKKFSTAKTIGLVSGLTGSAIGIFILIQLANIGFI
jgi:hypothetical protein